MKISIITPTSQVIGWNNPADVGISRIGVNTIGFGNGTAADITAIMQGGTLALGGATIGSNALAVTGAVSFQGNTSFDASGNVVAGNSLRTNDSKVGLGYNAAGEVSFQTLRFSAANITAANPAYMSYSAASTIQQGQADAAVAVAQTLRVQSVVAGTAAANGADWTHIGSLGTGTGTPGKMTFQVGVAQASGTAQSTATTALQLVGAANGSLPTVLMPGFANTATTSAVCYNTSTGLLTYDGTIGTCNTSTVRVKHDIVPVSSDSMLTGVLQMQPNSFFYNDDQNTPGQQLGLMAEDLEVIDPRLIAYDDEGKPSSIRYLGPMFSYLIGAIQAQQVEIEALRKNH